MSQVFADALAFLVENYPSCRVVILYHDPPGREPEVRAAHGLAPENFWKVSPVSLTLLRKVLTRGTPLLKGDAQQDATRPWSLEVSRIRSLACVPLFTPAGGVGGLVYLDDRSTAAVFSPDDLVTLSRYARFMEARLAARQDGRPEPVRESWMQKPPRERSRPRARPPASPPSVPSTRTRALFRGGPSTRELATLFRSLQVLFAAGVPLQRGLGVWSRQADRGSLRTACEAVAHDLERGSLLSAAMARAGCFGPIHLSMIQVGEATGALHAVLGRLADLEEKRYALYTRMQSALLYPSLLLVLTLGMVILAPPLLFGGYVELLERSGVELGWPTRAMIAISDCLRSPAFWLALAAGFLAFLSSAGRWLGSESMHARLLRVRGIGDTLRLLAISRFAQALALMVESGIYVHRALGLAADASGNPFLARKVREEAVPVLLEGSRLSGALLKTGVFPRIFLNIVLAGEESGALGKVLADAIRLYDVELDYRLETLTALVEPLLLMFLGLVAGFVILSTLLPMVRLVETL